MKTIKVFLFSCLFICALLSCYSQNKKEESYKDFPLEVTDEYKSVESYVLKHRPELGTFYVYNFEEPKIIQSYPCKGRFTVDSKGEIDSFTLSEDHELNGTILPESTLYTAMYNEANKKCGYLIRPTKDIMIQGYLVRHRGTLLNDYTTQFYNDGKLRSFLPVDNIEIDGIPCKGGGRKSDTWLYPDGSLWICYLSKDFEIDGKLFQKESRLFFDENGKAFEYLKHLHVEMMNRLKIY